MTKLAGKVALISGSGRGIGRAIALKLAADGARIVVNDLDEAPAAQVIDEIRRLGGEAVAVTGDVTDPDFAERFVAAALDTYQGIDIIINNAGYTWDATIQKTEDAQFQAMLDVHLIAPFRVLRAASAPIRSLAKQEAAAGRPVHRKVVNISSVAGLYGNAGQSGYASAKAGISGLTKTLAREWGRYLVNVNAVAFGLIETRLTQALGTDEGKISIAGNDIAVGIHPELLSSWAATIPLGRAGTPEDAAGAVYLLCLPEADYISGQVVTCSGGLFT